VCRRDHQPVSGYAASVIMVVLKVLKICLRGIWTVDQIGNLLPLPTKQDPELARAPLKATTTNFR